MSTSATARAADLARDLSCIRPCLDFNKTASTIAASTVYSKHDYFNYTYYNLAKPQIN